MIPGLFVSFFRIVWLYLWLFGCPFYRSRRQIAHRADHSLGLGSRSSKSVSCRHRSRRSELELPWARIHATAQVCPLDRSQLGRFIRNVPQMLEDIKTRVGGKSRWNSVFEGYLENVAVFRELLCNANRLQHHQYKIELWGFLVHHPWTESYSKTSSIAWWC
jgi:hypothetical protein